MKEFITVILYFALKQFWEGKTEIGHYSYI